MMKSEIIEAKIENRILRFKSPIFSGEAVVVKLVFDSGDAVASQHRIVLFGSDRKALAEGAFSEDGSGAWLATLNTATNEMAAYFSGVEVEGARSIGAMVVNANTADVITRGNVLVVCTPFPEDLKPCPQTYSYITEEELDAALEPIEGNISSLSSDVSGLSSMVSLKADISSLQQIAVTLSGKADLSAVSTIANDMADLAADLADKADASDVTALSNAVEGKISELSNTVAGKAETSDLYQLSSTVYELSGNLSTAIESKADASDVTDLADDMRSLAGSIGDLDTNKADADIVDDLAGEVDTLSGNVSTLSGNVNTLSASSLKSSQLITAITSSATDLEVPTGKAVYDAIQEGGGGGGVTGYTVTFANDFGTNSNKYYYMTSAPVTFVFADGTTETIDVEANKVQLRGRVIQNVIAVICNHWESDSWSLWADRDYTHLSINSLGMDINLLAPTYGGLYGDITPLAIFKPFAPVMVKRAYGFFSCLLKGTLVRLANGQDKPIEEITYGDELLVWDFDNGCLSTAKPLWIKQAQKAPFYFRNLLSDGHELLTVGEEATGGHRMFDADKSGFLYTAETVGDGIYTLDGIAKHKSCERIDAECEYYNIITGNHFNLFANGILTSCKLNNLYPISGMKFVKGQRELRPLEAYDVPLKYYKGLRLAEQGGDIGELTEYVERLVGLEK